MYYDHSGPTPRRKHGEPPRTVVNEIPFEPSSPPAPPTAYFYDEDGVRMRTARNSEGRPYTPIVPQGYGTAVWSEDSSEWYAPRLSSRHKTTHRAVKLYSPNNNIIMVPRHVLDACVQAQNSRCYVTGRKFRKGQGPALIRRELNEPLLQSNLVAVESWMLKGEEPVDLNLLVAQWETRVDKRKCGNVTSSTQELPF